MSLQLLHVQHCATNVVLTKNGFESISRWIDERIKADGKLWKSARQNPAELNVLHRMLTTDEPATLERKDALAFAALVEGYTTRAPVGDIPAAALKIAKGIRNLAREHEVLHLKLS